MCRYRQVCNNYRCGAQVQLPDELIQCLSKNCKFSQYHPDTCVLPACRRTCLQTRGYPEQYSPHPNAVCPNCAAGQRCLRFN